MHEGRASSLAPALAQLAALAVEGTVTNAAARSGTSQPTLSRAIAAWERDLGFPIVTRSGRRVALSEQGRVLAAAAAEALDTIDDALRQVRGESARPTLTVGFLRSLGPTVAGELIASFLRGRPDVVIVHREGSSTELADALAEGRMDITITAPRPPERLGWMPLGRQALVLVVPAGHWAAEQESVALADVRGEAFLALDRRFDARRRADALCASAGFAARIVLEADNLLTVRDYVAAGMGIAVLPADATPSARTKSVLIRSDDASRSFGLAWDPHRLPDDARDLIQHAETVSAKYPGWADVLG